MQRTHFPNRSSCGRREAIPLGVTIGQQVRREAQHLDVVHERSL
jgi:hypothetical protein